VVRARTALPTHASIDFRYPGEAADLEDAAESLDTVQGLREKLQALLDLPA
jgi:hypothetical protein